MINGYILMINTGYQIYKGDYIDNKKHGKGKTCDHTGSIY